MILLPLRTKNPPETLPFITYILLIANTLIFAATSKYFLVIQERAVELGGISLANPDPYRFLTSMFLHGDIMHLFGNMLLLWILGRAVEGRLGWWKFALLYLLAGAAGSLLHLGLAGRFSPEMPLIGASGAIYGVLGAALFMFPFAPVTFFYWIWMRIGTVDWPVWGVALYYLFFDFLGAWLSWGSEGGGVANLAHIGGAFAGLAICAAFQPKRDSAYVSEAKATLHETKDLSLLTRMQLFELHQMQPNNPEILYYYVVRCIAENKQVDPQLWPKFLAAFPHMLEHYDPVSLNSIVMWSMHLPQPIPPRELQMFAARCEKVGQPQFAFTIYDRIARDAKATPADWENALFQMGSIREQWFNDRAGAAQLYQKFMEHFPMSPLAPQVQNRLKQINGASVP